MKRLWSMLACLLVLSLVACGGQEAVGGRSSSETTNAPTSTMDTGELGDQTASEGGTVETISIQARGTTFLATLADSEAARQLAAQLPVSYDMSELNGNEKYAYSDTGFSTEGASVPSTINAGNVMLFGNDCVVVFYGTHSNDGYSYTPLATIDDPAGLAEALGSGSVTVTISAR